MKKNFKRWLPIAVCGGLLAFTITGCQNCYTPPAGDFKYDTFTGRERTEADKILTNVDVLTLEDAQKIALLNNPDYVSAYHAVTAAKMRYYQSFAGYAPTIGVSAGITGSISDVMSQHNYTAPKTDYMNSANLSFSANWLLFDGLSREFGVMAAKHGYSQAVALNDNARRQLLLAVAQAYYEILLAKANRDIALEDMSFQLKNLRETEVKHQYGAVPLSDVLNFQIQVNQADSNRLNAEYNYAAALFSLAALMGYPEGTIPDTVKFPEIKDNRAALLLSVDAYLDMALANRPDLKAYREQLKISEYQLYQTYSAYSPTIVAFAEYSLSTGKNVYHGYNKAPNRKYDVHAFNYGLTADWVVFNGFRRYNATREAQANLAMSEFAVAQIWLNVVNEVRTAYANYDLNNKQANLFSAILELVKEQRKLVQAEYEAGQAEIVRLNEAQRNLVSAQGTYVQAMVNMQRARAQLEAAANVNTLGRGFEKFSGAEVTNVVYAKKGMKANIEGKADPQEVAEYDALLCPKAEKKEPAADVVGPQKK